MINHNEDLNHAYITRIVILHFNVGDLSCTQPPAPQPHHQTPRRRK